MHRRTARPAVLTGLLAAIVLSGCSGTPGPTATHPPSASASAPVATASVTPSPSDNPRLDAEFPATITARRMGHDYVHLPVPSADLSALINIHGGLLAALADHGAFAGEVYPAISDNDGASWTIDGPQFAKTGACRGCATSRLLVSHDRALLAWGSGGRYVKTTTDRGKHWLAADFAGGVTGVSAAGRRLVARAVGSETAAGTFHTRQYVSTDDGRHWQRGAALGNVRHVR